MTAYTNNLSLSTYTTMYDATGDVHRRGLSASKVASVRLDTQHGLSCRWVTRGMGGDSKNRTITDKAFPTGAACMYTGSISFSRVLSGFLSLSLSLWRR